MAVFDKKPQPRTANKVVEIRRVCKVGKGGKKLSFRAIVIVGNQKVFKASDLQKFISGFQVLNPDLVICSLEKDVKLSIELNIEKGRGYVPAEENKKQSESIGVIAIDSIYTPTNFNCRSFISFHYGFLFRNSKQKSG